MIEAQILAPLTKNYVFTGHQIFLIPIIIAPIAEEIVFRLWLKHTSFNLSLSISVLSFYVGNMFLKNPIYTDPNLKHTLFATFFAVCVFLITYFLSKKNNNNLTSFFGRHTRLFFFFSAIAFGYVHMFNFEITPSIIYLSPIVFGSFISFGLIAGYIRIRFGFIYNVAFHMTANSIPILLEILLK